MRRFAILAASALAIAAPLTQATAANMCKTETLSCATTMPIGGYCECTARGKTEDGTVADRPTPGRRTNATAGGCGAHPNAPGCR